jgi:hypothetical protein
MENEIKEKKGSNSPPVPKEEKSELLKREEIRTMQKDISRLREIEAEKERKRIAALKLEEIKKKELPSPPEIEGPEAPLGTIIPKPLPRRPSPFKKALVRGVILAVLLFILSFSYWFLWVREPAEEVIPPTEKEIIPPEEKEEEGEEKPEISIPPSLISISETRISEISQDEEIPGIFNQLMEEELSPGDFTRIVIKNTNENRLSSLEDFSQVFQIEIPEGIFQKLEPDYTLTLYSQEQGKRVALVTKIKEKEGLGELLKAWEPETEKGISISGQEIPALVSYFKAANYKGVTFRYQTFSEDDLGICYSLFNDYFILTSSGESMLKTIDKLTE